ncbi:DUF1289 domain-containing protein [Alteromonas portus]|uniref:DUF1289 domain-containing protein n=1 Tax=Alteromonas portus TaxID=2565549 RepID=A0A4U0ZFV8_9ALTE|nr:DUF1289 domain-containing protein [Alteromonas portus]TKB03338.1 DUF1289 domain-containing protein [Alteromonas portus]
MTDLKAQSKQLEFFEIPSPCVGVCESGPRGFCKGCYRSRDERLYWLKVDDATKRKIISACVRRKNAFMAKLRKAQAQKGEEAAQQFSLFDEPPESR